jgi:hypothetical protein
MVAVTIKETEKNAEPQEIDAVDAGQQGPFEPGDERQEPMAQFTRLAARRILGCFTLCSCTINLLSFSTCLSMVCRPAG